MTTVQKNGLILGQLYEVCTYYYDPFGRRLLKDVNGTKTYFFYTDEGLNAEFDHDGTEIKTYGFRPNSIWTTDPLFMKIGSEYFFYHNDHLGTPQKMTAVNGAVVWKAKYESFGKAIIDGESSIENNLRFPGQYADSETGIHYNHHRYYDPDTGRYLTPDPIGLEGGINPFVYALNNPINMIDPSGLIVLPMNPGGLPHCWEHDPSHRDPNGMRFRHPNGDVLDFHRGRPGLTGWKGKDHWHHNFGDDHLPPGYTIPGGDCRKKRRDPCKIPEPNPAPTTIMGVIIIIIINIVTGGAATS